MHSYKLLTPVNRKHVPTRTGNIDCFSSMSNGTFRKRADSPIPINAHNTTDSNIGVTDLCLVKQQTKTKTIGPKFGSAIMKWFLK